jgi:hypothetical protein
MIPKNIKIIQLYDSDCMPSGLYITEREDIVNFQDFFNAAFSNREVEDIHSNADDWLETHKQIFRVFAEQVNINNI